MYIRTHNTYMNVCTCICQRAREKESLLHTSTNVAYCPYQHANVDILTALNIPPRLQWPGVLIGVNDAASLLCSGICVSEESIVWDFATKQPGKHVRTGIDQHTIASPGAPAAVCHKCFKPSHHWVERACFFCWEHDKNWKSWFYNIQTHRFTKKRSGAMTKLLRNTPSLSKVEKWRAAQNELTPVFSLFLLLRLLLNKHS